MHIRSSFPKIVWAKVENCFKWRWIHSFLKRSWLKFQKLSRGKPVMTLPISKHGFTKKVAIVVKSHFEMEIIIQLNQFQKHSFKESIFRFLALCKSGFWSLHHSQGHVQPPDPPNLTSGLVRTLRVSELTSTVDPVPKPLCKKIGIWSPKRVFLKLIQL